MSTAMHDRSGTQRPSVEKPSPARWPILLGAVVLTYLVCAVFFPVLGFDFIDYDVRSQILDNQHIKGLTAKNIKHIFTSRCVTSYYPVRTLTLAADYQLWGLDPTGFKLTNSLIHLTNVLLVFWLVLRLFSRPAQLDNSPGAWWDVVVATFSAGLFAVHPVVVEPVAWVPGREELLMALGALGCIHFHITARRFSQKPGKTRWATTCHVAAAFCCAVACLSNAVAAAIPLLILTWDLLTLAKPTARKLFRPTAALWVIGAATIAIKRAGYFNQGVDQADPLSLERLKVVFRVYWLNMKTLFWPTDLGFSYSPFQPGSFLDAEVMLGGMAIVVSCLILWAARRQKSTLFGLLWFGLALGPSSQVLMHHIPRADRFLYLPLVGLSLATASAARPLGKLVRHRAALGGVIAAGVAGLLVLDTLSTSQVSTWQHDLTVCQQALKVDPHNALAHCSLADRLFVRRCFRLAAQTYEDALRLHPDNERILINYASMLATCDDLEFRDYPRAVRLAERACRLNQWKNPTLLHTLSQIHFAYAESLAEQRRFDQVSENYVKAVDAMLQLALRLAVYPEKRQRRPKEAVQLAERACQLIGYPSPLQLGKLAEVYAATGRFDRAIAAAETAVKLARAAGDSEMIAELERRVNLYRVGIPADPPPD